MSSFIKYIALAMVAFVMWIVLSNFGKHFAVLLSITVCCVLIGIATTYFEPVLTFINKLQQTGGWNHEIMTILLKACGIGLIADIVVMIFNDAGNTAMGKAVTTLSVTAILWLSLPLFTELLDMIGKILGEL